MGWYKEISTVKKTFEKCLELGGCTSENLGGFCFFEKQL